MSPSRNNNRLQFWGGILISALSLVILLFFVDLEQVADELIEANYLDLLMAAGGVILFLVLRAVRWQFMLGEGITVSQIFHIQNIGYLITYILPFRLGDVARAILVGNLPTVTLARGLSTMVVERVLDMLFIVTLLPFTLVGVARLPEEYQFIARTAGVLAAVAAVGLLLLANQRGRVHRFVTSLLRPFSFLDAEAWGQRADDLLAGMSTLTRLRDLLWLIFLSILVWVPILFAYYMGLRAVHLNPTWAMAGFTVAAAALVVTAPSSPGQIGVFHLGVTAALVQVLGQPEDPAFSFSVLYHATNMLVVLVMGILGISRVQVDLGNVIAAARQVRSK